MDKKDYKDDRYKSKDENYKPKDDNYKSKDDFKKDFKKPYPALKDKKDTRPQQESGVNSANPKMIEVVVNDRLGKKVRVKCCPDDTIGDLKKLIAAHTGTRPEKLRLQKWYNVYKDHITLQDYEITHGMGLELYYN